MPSRLCALVVALVALSPQAVPSRQDVLDAMRTATTFYLEKVSTRGGYHFSYSDDLSYGRSEQSEGKTQIELQREGTPIVGMTFLDVYEITGDRFYLEAARKAGQALVDGQLCSGGWDYLVEFDPSKRSRYPYRKDRDCSQAGIPDRPPTTFDDNVTQACLRLLMRIDRALDFKDAPIHEAALFALSALVKVQYPNGAWPQRYSQFPDPAKFPVKRASYPASWPRQWPGGNYLGHYTFNDNSIADCIDTMLEAARIYSDPRYLASAERGGDFMLLAQMPDPQPAWAQQYDIDMHPSWARVFEPPSITGGESQGILRMLMVLYGETGKKKYLDAVPGALAYLEKSVLPRPGNAAEIWSRIPAQAGALARFYELRTNRPLYITKGTQISVKGSGLIRPDGYEVSYSDASVITHYAVLVSAAELPSIRQEYTRVAAADPSTLRRPDKLRGLSPWTASPRSRDSQPDGPRIARIIQSLDERGAWVEEGVIGKADQVASVSAARPMVLTINGRSFPIAENDRIALFDGAQPPRQRIIQTATFVRNLETMAAYVTASR
jgi:PelA/Pel-15E family pectate lyase